MGYPGLPPKSVYKYLHVEGKLIGTNVFGPRVCVALFCWPLGSQPCRAFLLSCYLGFICGFMVEPLLCQWMHREVSHVKTVVPLLLW